ncbi:hypothetical protein ADUPG1_007978, partial [Aduncisulcus paluster]
MIQFATACAAASSSMTELIITNSTTDPIVFDTSVSMLCNSAKYSLIVSFESEVEFMKSATLKKFTFAGDGNSDITFYGATTLQDLSISNAKIKIAKSDDPLVLRDVSITSSQVRVSYPSLIPYNVSLYEETSLTVVGTLKMLPGTYISAIADDSMQNVSIVVKGDIEFTAEGSLGKPGRIVAKNIINANANPFLLVDGGMCHMSPSSIYSATSVDLTNITISGWNSPVQFSGSIPSSCDVDGNVQFGLKGAAFSNCKANRGGALQVESNLSIEQVFMFDQVTFDSCTAIGGGAIYTGSPLFVKGFGVDSIRPDVTKSLADYQADGSYIDYPLIISDCTATSGGAFVLAASEGYQKNVSLELLPTSKKMKSFLETNATDDDDALASTYKALIPFVLDNCSATYGEKYNTDAVHVCYTVDSTTLCPSMNADFEEAVSSKAWDASLSSTAEYDSDDYYAVTVQTFLDQLAEDAGIDPIIYDADSFSGNWLDAIIQSSDSGAAIEALFEDETADYCYTDPFGHAAECICQIDAYMDPDTCGVSFSDFDDLEVVVKEVTGNPCDEDITSDACQCYLNPSLDGCAVDNSNADFFTCFNEDFDVDGCCDTYGGVDNSLFCCYSSAIYMPDADATDVATCNDFTDDIYGDPTNEYYDNDMGYFFEECYNSISDDGHDLATCCLIFTFDSAAVLEGKLGVEVGSLCKSAYTINSYVALAIMMDWSLYQDEDGYTITSIIESYCITGKYGEGCAICEVLLASKVPFYDIFDICMDTFGSESDCCSITSDYQEDTFTNLLGVSQTAEVMYYPRAICPAAMVLYNEEFAVDFADADGVGELDYYLSMVYSLDFECSHIMTDDNDDPVIDITGTMCDFGSGENSLATSNSLCFETYTVEECCSFTGITAFKSFYELGTDCQKHRIYETVFELLDESATVSSATICARIALDETTTFGECDIYDVDLTCLTMSYYEPDYSNLSEAACLALLTDEPDNYVDCLTWSSSDNVTRCSTQYPLVVGSSFDMVDLLSIELEDDKTPSLSLQNSFARRKARRALLNASPKPYIHSTSATVTDGNSGISIDGYEKAVSVSLYSYFGEPTISLQEDGAFVTIATAASDDLYNKAAISPMFYKFVSSFTDAPTTQTQNIVVAAVQEEVHGHAFIKVFGSEVNAYKLSVYLPTCNIDSAHTIPGQNPFRGMCVTCNGPTTYKGIKETGADCQACPEGANCHNGGSIGSDPGYWTWVDPDNEGAIVVRSDGTVIHHECPVDDTCTGTDVYLTANNYKMTSELYDVGCAEGHNELLCLTCDEGWVRGGPNDGCGECGDTSTVAYTFGAILLFQFIFMFYGCIQTAREQLEDTEENKDNNTDGAIEMTESVTHGVADVEDVDSNSEYSDDSLSSPAVANVQSVQDAEEEEEDPEDEEYNNTIDATTATSLLLSHWQLLVVAPWGVQWGVLKLDSFDLSPKLFNTGLMCIWPDIFTPWMVTMFNMIFPTVVIVSSFFGMPYIMRKLHSVFKMFDAGVMFSLFCEIFLLIATEAAAAVF